METDFHTHLTQLKVNSTPESIWFTFCRASLFMVNWKAARSDIRPGIKVHISWLGEWQQCCEIKFIWL